MRQDAEAPVKLPVLRPDDTIWLNYDQAAEDDSKLLVSLSTLVTVGPFLWTASDECRTLECLERDGKNFRLRTQLRLDDVFGGLPGKDDGDEVDVEAIDAANGNLWICGSHCRVRKKPKKDKTLNPELRDRESRHLLGHAKLLEKGTALAAPGTALPFGCDNSLRAVLQRENPYIAPFIDLPSKENGLDIEGMCVAKGKVFLGLRGPLVDSIAIILEARIAQSGGLDPSKMITHLVDLRGLGVRDLTRVDGALLVLAGPVSGADEQFRIYRWRPKNTELVQRPDAVCEWPRNDETPEGICRLDNGGKSGFAVLYDSPDPARIKGTRYRADWIAAGKIG